MTKATTTTMPDNVGGGGGDRQDPASGLGIVGFR